MLAPVSTKMRAPLVFLYFTSLAIFALDQLRTDMSEKAHRETGRTFFVFVILNIVAYFRVYLSPAQSPNEPLGQNCARCQCLASERSLHCTRGCDRCIDDFDHHCPLLGVCIGKGNIAAFRVYLITNFTVLFEFTRIAVTAREYEQASQFHGVLMQGLVVSFGFLTLAAASNCGLYALLWYSGLTLREFTRKWKSSPLYQENQKTVTRLRARLLTLLGKARKNDTAMHVTV